MTSPKLIGILPVVIVPIRSNRANLILQNVSDKCVIYIKKIPLSGIVSHVSETNFEFRLMPDNTPGNSSNTKEMAIPFVTNSINSFEAIGSTADGKLAIYETKYVAL